MEEKSIKRYVGKRVFLKTTFGRFFTVDIQDVKNNVLVGTDKFNEPVDLCIDDIATIIPDAKSKW